MNKFGNAWPVTPGARRLVLALRYPSYKPPPSYVANSCSSPKPNSEVIVSMEMFLPQPPPPAQTSVLHSAPLPKLLLSPRVHVILDFSFIFPLH